MSWIKACLHNRLAIYLSAFAICIAGLVSLYVMPIAPFPVLSFNNMRISFSYPGANADTVQSQVTTKVSNALQGVPNIKTLRATSRDGGAQIQLVLNSVAPDAVLQTQMQVMQAIAASHLPTAVPQPQIEQSMGMSGLLTYMLTSDKLGLFKIDNYIQAQLLPNFSSIPGVKAFSNDQQPTLHIGLLPDKLALYHLNASTIADNLNNAFMSQPLGKLYIKQQPYQLGLRGQLQTIPDFSQLIIGQTVAAGGAVSQWSRLTGTQAQPLRLQDVAKIRFAPREPVNNYYSSFNGKIADSVVLLTTTNANPFQVSAQAQSVVSALSSHLPADLKMTLTNNATTMMHASFNEVFLTIGISSILVLLIALIFLGHLRTTLVPIITIPICLLGSLLVVQSLGYSLNIFTLLAMVIAVGLVVDDAIVVVENITRHLEEGMPKFEAVMHGSADIALTIIGITATLLAVYLPIAFVGGSAFMTLLKAFAVPLAAAVFFSGIVALTLTPVMCDKLLVIGADNAFQRSFNAGLARVIGAYQVVLKLVLKWRYMTLLVIVAVVAAGVLIDRQLPQTFFPADPNGDLSIHVNAGPEDTIQSLHQKLGRFLPQLDLTKVAYRQQIIQTDSMNGQLGADFYIHYKDAYLHQLPQIGAAMQRFIQQQGLDNSSVRVSNVLDISFGRGDIDISLYAAQGIAAVNTAATRLTDLLRKSPLFAHVANTIQLPQKQFAFDIDMVKAARLGITRQQITRLLSTGFGGQQLSNAFNIVGLAVPVLVRLDAASLQNPQVLQLLQITAANGRNYPLSEFVNLHMVAKPTVLTSLNGERSVDLQLNLAPGASLKEAIPYLDAQLAVHAASISYQYHGAAADFLAGSHQTMLVAILGIFCIYFLLALLFRSLLDPFIILLTVPFSVVFGAASLFLVHGSLNIYSTLALITLIGLITKHGVLIVQFANHELHRGASVREALLAATHHRFRPIIMTTLAMTFGAFPLLLSSGAMYVARQDLAVVLIGGLVIGTLFSLFIVPLMYSLLKREPIKPTTALLTK